MAGFIKFDGIDGEAQDQHHKGWSNIDSFDQLIHKPGQGTGQTRRRADVVLEDIHVLKELDKASPKLAEAVCKGKVFAKVEIHVSASYTDAGRVTYLAYELKNVQVVNYTINGATQATDVIKEHLSLNFEEIKVVYTENDEKGKKKGNIEYHWLVEAGKT